ncbi:hypothetical protein GH714_035608 [Hevea brasiliensis]|uniref:Uncharacterized protein n=1 Tax=Hevea brasiliensis TaxID=3981 RepID=A0A6A6M797_HEVBR|nr:hypothetical protein GH714_035608 [Hevea brasiliensis]
MHGAWTWYKLTPVLEAAGHKVTALDLAASGIDPRQIEQIGSFDEYSEPLLTFMASLPEGEKHMMAIPKKDTVPFTYVNKAETITGWKMGFKFLSENVFTACTPELAIENYKPDKVYKIEGGDQKLMLSKTNELAQILNEVADTYMHHVCL